MNTATLPWAGMSNVKCELSRTADGTVCGRCTIVMPSGEPIVLEAKANERQIAQWILKRYAKTQTAVAGGRHLNPTQLSNAARQQVVNKLAVGFRKVIAGNVPAAPGARPNNVLQRLGITPAQAKQMLAVRSPQARAQLVNLLRKRLLSRMRQTATSGAAVNLANGARRLLQRARQGDPRARRILANIDRRARAGVAKAVRDRRILAAVAKEAPNAAAAGMIEIASPVAEIGAMSLHNYYTIGGKALTPEHFYAGCSTGEDGTRTCSGAQVLQPQVDLIIGADGKQFGKTWNGVRWVWNELGPRRGYRSEAQNFGVRDALLLGMQRIQQRELNG